MQETRNPIIRRWYRLGLLTLMVMCSLGTPLTSIHARPPYNAEVQSMVARLQSVPVFSNMATQRVFDVFQWGKQVGKHPNVFTTIGDSNTTNGDFMRPLGVTGSVCELGPYAELQTSIDYFSAPIPGLETNSFAHGSAAAGRGFSSAAVLDPFWADRAMCNTGETPLLCEYRVSRPAAAIIMLGQIDINYGDLTVEEYRANMERIIQHSIGDGVIPVLTTIVFLPERDEWPLSLEYNLALLDLSAYYGVPLINLWSAAQMLPNHGIGPDRSHLAAHVGSFCSFTGAEREFGGTLRNLLTLQALHELHRTVLTQP